MKITQILSYLTYPSKNREEQPVIGGTAIPLDGQLYQMLADIFERSDRECNIPICFKHAEDGGQKNPCLDELVQMEKDKSVGAGRSLAERLQAVTTGKSGIGLLFIILGESEKEKKILLSRFPADQGIIAEQKSGVLRVELVEDVFLKSAHAYKAAMYRGESPYPDFWVGNAVDKQITHGAQDLARYWIYDFLQSDFQTTPQAGSKRLAVAMRDGIRKTSEPEVKQEITAAATLVRNLSGKAVTINDFCNQFHLSEPAREAVCENIKNERLLSDRFFFDLEEFERHISYKSVEINTGAVMTAPVQIFDECFKRTQIPDTPDEFIFEARGKIVDERLKKQK